MLPTIQALTPICRLLLLIGAIVPLACAGREGASVLAPTATRPTQLASAPAAVPPHAEPVVAVARWPQADPAAAGLDAEAVQGLVRRAEEAESDALVIVVDGRVVVEEYFGRPRGPIEAMSATKSIVALAIGLLIDQGKIDSLDTPVHTFFPEWRQGKKADITIRHLLTHTSGLQNFPRTDIEIYPSPDFVQLALAADLEADPGMEFSYNNKAVNLLAGIVERASGTRMDRYIGGEIFAPLGIADFSWSLDRSGNPHAMAGLKITALDLARVGQLVLDGGTHEGARIVSREFLDEAMRPGPERAYGRCGLLWWLEPEFSRVGITAELMRRWRDAGAEAAFLRRLRPLVGRQFTMEIYRAEIHKTLKTRELRQLFYENTRARGLPQVELLEVGPIVAYRAEGYLGQHLVVVPSAHLVGVRQKRAPVGDAKVDDMGDFTELVRALPTRRAVADVPGPG